jgi:shikimate kinase
MVKPRNIFLVGPMGAGKTTIGRYLAAALGYDFDDSDHEIQQRTGVDIPTIFEFEGEQGFRHREAQVIDALTQREHLVLATGGGVILNPENRKRLTSRGWVIYLFCSPEQQYERTARDRNRPLLQTDNPLQKLKDLMVQRDPLYRQVADLVITTEKRTATTVVREIRKRLEQNADRYDT